MAAMGSDLAWIRGGRACKRNLGIPIFDGDRSRLGVGVLLGNLAFDVAKRVERGRSLNASRILQCDLCGGDAPPRPRRRIPRDPSVGRLDGWGGACWGRGAVL